MGKQFEDRERAESPARPAPTDPVDLRRELEQLRHALTSRATIDQAKGILMARHRVDAVTAFALLDRASQQHNVKLSRLAAALVQHTVDEQVPAADDLRPVVLRLLHARVERPAAEAAPDGPGG